MKLSLERLRRYAIARSLFRPTTLGRALGRLGFVQADPIRAPARAQDLVLRHRVVGYVAGDLERRYPRLPIEEDFFVNYGFLLRDFHCLMHPRVPRTRWSASRLRKAQEVLEFVRERGVVHPREVDAHFAHGKVTNWFGGSSNATTQLLDQMHFRGLLRIARRENGIRMYAVRDAEAARAAAGSPAARFDALIDLVVNKYAPLPAPSLGKLLSHLCVGTPQWRRHRAAALSRARGRLACGRIEGQDWYWPADESPASRRWRPDDQVRLLAPFDPVVWDRLRFQRFWEWEYRFEAYTPAHRRRLGYYAMPLLWRDQVIGWGNLSVADGQLRAGFGYVAGSAPHESGFQEGLEAELQRMGRFLQLSQSAVGRSASTDLAAPRAFVAS